MSSIWKAAAAALLLALPATATSATTPAHADATAYAAIRIVKTTAGAPSTPQITLPGGGYSFLIGDSYQWASRGEYYAFIQGPRTAEGIDVTVTWPGTPIHTVITDKAHLALTRAAGGDPWAVAFRLPVTAGSAYAARWTLEVFSYPSGDTSSGVYWRIEHNHPDRAAGYWATVPWPKGEARAAINYMVATEAVLQHSGLAAEARRRGHFYSLMGFETNNLLHLDNPPHWHLAYYAGLTFGAPSAHVPHLWMDAQGRNFYNGMDVKGLGRQEFRAGDPARIHDAEGNLVVTLTIRADGGLDIDPPSGPRYSILNDGDAVRVLRDGAPWSTVVCEDDVVRGKLTTTVGDQTTVYHYDPLTGVVTWVESLPPNKTL